MKQYLTYKNLNYCLIYKNKKKLSIKFMDGQIIVSAPYHTPISFIERCLEDCKDRLEKQIESYNPYYDLKDGGYVYIFNEKYILVKGNRSCKGCFIDGDKLIVCDNDINKAVSKYLYNILYDYLEERIKYYVHHSFDTGMPEIVIKRYKGRWGSCYYKVNRVSFNFALIHFEKELIDYIIVHELCHFIVHNHSALFYNEVEKRLPDYKSLMKRIEEKHI